MTPPPPADVESLKMRVLGINVRASAQRLSGKLHLALQKPSDMDTVPAFVATAIMLDETETSACLAPVPGLH